MAVKKPFSLRRVTRKTASYFMVIPCKRNQKGQYRLKIKMTAKARLLTIGPRLIKSPKIISLDGRLPANSGHLNILSLLRT